VIALLLRAADGRALILSTHQLAPVLPHFPRLVGLRAGRVLFDAPREEVTARELALLYQPEGATHAPEPRRVLVAGPAAAEVRVGASTTPGEHILPVAAAAFAAAEPAVTLRLSVKGTAAVLRDLAAGAVELAFVGAREEREDLHFEDFAEDEIVLIAASSFAGLPEPLPAAAVARLPRVDREPSSATRAIAEAQLAAMGAPLDPDASVLEAGSVAALIEAVSAGMGVGFASRRSVARAVAERRVRLVAIDATQIPRRFFVAWRRGTAMSEPAARFLAQARRAAAGNGS
jgi:phosphonate transport system ATP-binding protein